MRVHYLQHAAFENIGVIEYWAQTASCSFKGTQSYLGQALPDIDSFDFLIIMGGPQSAVEVEKYPYLMDEVNLIKAAIEHEKLILGFCLGAQLISIALGARAERSPHKEVGTYPIQLTSAGKQDPILNGLPEQFAVIHWHNDMPGLTDDAVVLADSAGCPRQIVRFADHIYGFQCHLEPTKQGITSMLQHCVSDLQAGQYVQSAEQMLAFDFDKMHQQMLLILNNLTARYLTKIQTAEELVLS